MASHQNDNRSYSKLAQFYKALRGDYPKAHLIKNILKKEGDINYQIPSNSPIKTIEPDFIGSTALHISVIKKEREIFEILLDSGADFTIQNQKGHTVLHYVFYDKPSAENEDFISILLSQHLSLANSSNPCDNNGLSHFHIACMKNETDVVKFFLNNGIPVDIVVNEGSEKFAGYSPLHFAAEGLAMPTIKILLKHKANMNAKDSRGLTPLHIILGKRIEMLDVHSPDDKKASKESLAKMENIMNLLLDSDEVDHLGITQLHIACTQRDSSVAEYLLEQSVNVDQQVKMESPIFPGYTALHFAAHFNLNIVKMLIKKGANFEVKDAKGTTPLDIFRRERTTEDILKIFAQNWNEVKFSDRETRMSDLLKFISKPTWTSWHNRLNPLRIGAEPNYWRGRTGLHFMVMLCERSDAIEKSMKPNLPNQVDIEDYHGATPIHWAYRMNKLEILEFLMKSSHSFYNIADGDGLSYLHIACAVNNTKYINQIIYQSPNINKAYHGTTTVGLVKPGYTALHVAITVRNFTVINLLLDRGLDLEAKDAKGHTPIQRFLQLDRDDAKLIYDNFITLSTKITDSMFKNIGLTRLHLAIYFDDPNFRNYVTWYNNDVIIRCDDTSSLLHPYDGCTALHMAIKRGLDSNIVKVLLDGSANLLAKNQNNHSETPLYEALACKTDRKVMSEILLKLKNDKILREKMEEDSGITILHIACHVMDLEYINELLNNGNNKANARVKRDCYVWAYCTPLHVLLKAIELYGIKENFCDTLKALLSAGANAAAMDEIGETPVHLSLRYLSVPEIFTVIKILVDKLSLYNVNPVDGNGMSHFHAACLMNNIELVKLFIKSGVDVNRPIDFFAEDLPGETPLHLAVDHRNETLVDPEVKRETIYYLLESGADVKAEDNIGHVPLHKAVKLKIDVLEKFIGYGASVNTANIFEQTPLELILQSENLSPEGIEFFAKYGGRLDASNPLTEEGFISMLISKRYHPCLREIEDNPEIKLTPRFQAITNSVHPMVNSDNELTTNEMGRTLLHNIVTTNNPCYEIFNFEEIVKKYNSDDIDIDLQDKKGKTALHLAAQFGNGRAVVELLFNAADINVVDVLNKTPLNYAKECYNKNENVGYEVAMILVYYALQLKEFSLRLVPNNTYENNRQLFNKFRNTFMDDFRKEIAKFKREMHVMVDKQSNLFLDDFMSELGRGLIKYPYMSDVKREKIKQFFADYEGDCEDVCKLQYKKAVKRYELVKLAVNPALAVTGYTLPMVCIEMIFQYLTNTDLDTFVKATVFE